MFARILLAAALVMPVAVLPSTSFAEGGKGGKSVEAGKSGRIEPGKGGRSTEAGKSGIPEAGKGGKTTESGVKAGG